MQILNSKGTDMTEQTYAMQFTEYQRQLLYWALQEFELNLEREDIAREYNAIMQQLTGETTCHI